MESRKKFVKIEKDATPKILEEDTQWFVDSFIHWEFLPEGQTIKAMYQKRYWTALKKNELGDADPDPINNWFFLHNNSPACKLQ